MIKPLLFTVSPEHYDEYLKDKTEAADSLFMDVTTACPKAEVFKSQKSYFRNRAEFAIGHDNGQISYVMFEKKGRERIRYQVSSFPMANHHINAAMELLRRTAPSIPEISDRLFEVEFLSNQAGDVIIALDYHRQLNKELWTKAAKQLIAEFSKNHLHVSLVGQARKQRIAIPGDWLLETFHTKDGHEFKLFEVIGNFTQPNTSVAEHMISFARECCQDQKERDLLELYCGSGTFTVCLADLFRKALATEVSRVPAQTVAKNIHQNGITNIKTARLSAEEMAQALDGVRTFHRLSQIDCDLKDYDFSTLLIDPPRSGLGDELSLAFTARFERVVYISCNPKTQCSDLRFLLKTHYIAKRAYFDQFPYTPHLESGVLLLRK